MANNWTQFSTAIECETTEARHRLIEMLEWCDWGEGTLQYTYDKAVDC